MSQVMPLPEAPAAHALNRQAIARLIQGDPVGALATFRRCVELDANYPEAWNNSGLVRQGLGQLAEALADFDRALAIRPDYPEALTNRGRARQAQGDIAGAFADFDAALACCSDRFAASVLHNRGALRQAQGDLVGALADFDRALDVAPEHIATYVQRGTARKEIGDLTGALADLDWALEQVAPNLRAAVYHKRGGVRVLQGDFTGAINDYDEALALEPDNVIFYISRGNARYHRRDPRGAIDYRMAFRLDAETTRRELAHTIVEDARRDGASVLENCDKHLRINARDGLAFVRRGLTLLILDRTTEAGTDLAQACELHPDLRQHLDGVIAQVRGC